jgi:hypothetical protein
MPQIHTISDERHREIEALLAEQQRGLARTVVERLHRGDGAPPRRLSSHANSPLFAPTERASRPFGPISRACSLGRSGPSVSHPPVEN